MSRPARATALVTGPTSGLGEGYARRYAADDVISVPGLQYKALTSVSRLIPRGLSRTLTNTFGRGRGRT